MVTVDGMHSRLSEYPFLAGFHVARAALRDVWAMGARPLAMLADIHLADDGLVRLALRVAGAAEAGAQAVRPTPERVRVRGPSAAPLERIRGLWRWQILISAANRELLRGSIERIEDFGLFVKLPSGARGLVPAPETGTPRGTDLRKSFPLGKRMQAKVIDVDRRGEVKLSIKALKADAEKKAKDAPAKIAHAHTNGKRPSGRTSASQPGG